MRSSELLFIVIARGLFWKWFSLTGSFLLKDFVSLLQAKTTKNKSVVKYFMWLISGLLIQKNKAGNNRLKHPPCMPSHRTSGATCVIGPACAAATWAAPVTAISLRVRLGFCSRQTSDRPFASWVLILTGATYWSSFTSSDLPHLTPCEWSSEFLKLIHVYEVQVCFDFNIEGKAYPFVCSSNYTYYTLCATCGM